MAPTCRARVTRNRTKHVTFFNKIQGNARSGANSKRHLVGNVPRGSETPWLIEVPSVSNTIPEKSIRDESASWSLSKTINDRVREWMWNKNLLWWTWVGTESGELLRTSYSAAMTVKAPIFSSKSPWSIPFTFKNGVFSILLHKTLRFYE